jgi:hypothetical protein
MDDGRGTREVKRQKIRHPKGVFFYAQVVLKRRFLVLKRAFFDKKRKKVDWGFQIEYIFLFENALSHGVAKVAKAAYGVSSFHGMADSSLRQGQIGRDKTVSVTAWIDD